MLAVAGSIDCPWNGNPQFERIEVMAVPKRRISKARGRKRRSHNAVKLVQLVYCPQCSTATPSHVVCPNCGYYQGRTLVETED